TKGKSLCVHFRDRYYEFPKNEVILLPIVNTSVEELSKYLLDKLSAQLSQYSLKGLKITIAETRGQAATLTNFF
ncbi:MAG TPA: 6-pyruvoyl tetrahydropterin synthase, partial [Pseudobdellovibrionaceae bacterium]|nr:6-pyruvoyl tetrahydropterin synthase [Pseudobdellovibrionaceae bacterium]